RRCNTKADGTAPVLNSTGLPELFDDFGQVGGDVVRHVDDAQAGDDARVGVLRARRAMHRGCVQRRQAGLYGRLPVSADAVSRAVDTIEGFTCAGGLHQLSASTSPAVRA